MGKECKRNQCNNTFIIQFNIDRITRYFLKKKYETKNESSHEENGQEDA